MASIVEASAPVGQIQTDTFCPGCGYNLFTQAVIREPHTEILVCRCPECGKFSPAEIATGAADKWGQARHMLLLLLRILLILYALGMALVGMGVLPYAVADEMVRFSSYKISQCSANGGEQAARGGTQLLMMRMAFGVAAIGLGLITGAFVVVVFYHWPRKCYRWFLLTPLLALLVAAACWQFDPPQTLLQPIGSSLTLEHILQNDPEQRRIASQFALPADPLGEAPGLANKAQLENRLSQRREELARVLRGLWPLPSPAVHMAAVAALITAGLWTGMRVGRPAVRGMLRVVLSAHALQPFAMLWWADNKIAPTPRPPVSSSGEEHGSVPLGRPRSPTPWGR